MHSAEILVGDIDIACRVRSRRYFADTTPGGSLSGVGLQPDASNRLLRNPGQSVGMVRMAAPFGSNLGEVLVARGCGYWLPSPFLSARCSSLVR